jgi:hypothetical protein
VRWTASVSGWTTSVSGWTTSVSRLDDERQ